MTDTVRRLTDRSRSSFILDHGELTRILIVRCEEYAMRLSDAAESERSSALRLFMNTLSGRTMLMVNELEKALGNEVDD